MTRDLPSSSHALFAEVKCSSSVNAVSIASAASRLSPRSRGAVYQERALFSRPPAQPSSVPVLRSASRFLCAAARFRLRGAVPRPPGWLILQAFSRARVAGLALFGNVRIAHAFPAQQRAAWGWAHRRDRQRRWPCQPSSVSRLVVPVSPCLLRCLRRSHVSHQFHRGGNSTRHQPHTCATPIDRTVHPAARH